MNMYEIDCSSLPDELARVAIEAAEETVERTDYDTHGVEVLRNTKLVTLNGDSRNTNELYGALRQSMLSAVQTSLKENHEKYTEEELEEYFQGLEFRKV